MKEKLLEIGSIVLVIVLIIVGVTLTKDNASNKETVLEKDITIAVFDKESKNIYSGDLVTEANFLIDALEEAVELNVVTEDGPYGAYITSIMGIEQGDNFYWTYYIGDEYAIVGVSRQEIEDGKTYNFKIEEYTN